MTQECNEGSSKQECQTKGGSSSCGSKGSGCEMTDMVMGLTHKAWGQLMVEKMKAELEKTRGEKMNKVAAAAIAASLAKWEHKMSGKVKCQEPKDNLKRAFME